MADTPTPATIYGERLTSRRAAAAALSERLDRLSYARLGTFLLALVFAGVGFGTDWLSPWFALAPLAAFFYLVAKFEMTRGRKAWAERAAAYYSSGLDRLAGKPGGTGDGARFAGHEHPYADDLDLFGPASIFERLTACRTRVGEETLAAWLLAPASPEEVRARQEAVTDLRPRLDLREAVAVAGANALAADYRDLAVWGTKAPATIPRWRQWAVEILGWGNVAAWVGWFGFGTTAIPVAAFGLPSLLLVLPRLAWAWSVLKPLEKVESDLSLLESILTRLEREEFTATGLKELQTAMTADGLLASEQIRELRNLLQWYDSRKNPLFMPFAILRMWSVRFAMKLEVWRRRSGPATARWLRAVAGA